MIAVTHTNHVLLLTGVPGVGKTTVIRRVAEHVNKKQVLGFYTEEIRQDGHRQGFRLVSFNGRDKVIAHVTFPKHSQVGKYGVDVDAIDEMSTALLVPSGKSTLYLIDEIGKMECHSRCFVNAVRKLLHGGHIIIATVGLKGSGFIAEVKQQTSLLWEVKHDNRDAMPHKVLDWLVGELKS
jgi:nucleoside-triphosphatase